MKVEEVAEKYGHNVEDIGAIGKALLLEADSEEAVMISLRPGGVVVPKQDEADMVQFFVSAGLFQHIFKSTFNMDRLNDPDVKIYVTLEVPNGYLKDIYVKGCEVYDGIYYNVQQGPPSEFEMQTKMKDLNINVNLGEEDE